MGTAERLRSRRPARARAWRLSSDGHGPVGRAGASDCGCAAARPAGSRWSWGPPAPAVEYPAIFPDRHPYYEPDLGLDLIGAGTAADDNKVVWNQLFLHQPGGNTTVPYMFAFFAQGGIGVALLGSLLVGLLWRPLW